MSNEIMKAGFNFDLQEIMRQAIEKGTAVEVMEKLMQMRDKMKSEAAKEAYNTALSAFQAECPTIDKSKSGGTTKSGKVAYKYAPLELIVEQVKLLLHKNGFSYDIKSSTTEKGVTVTCISKHIGGHEEKTTIEMPFSTRTEIMSAPQQVAATITFATRYAVKNAFGIVTGDEDTDGQDERPGQPRNGKAQDLPRTTETTATHEPEPTPEPEKPDIKITAEPSYPAKPSSSRKPEPDEKTIMARKKLADLLKEYCQGEGDQIEMLKQLTEWEDNKGVVHEGRTTFKGMSEKMADIARYKLEAIIKANKKVHEPEETELEQTGIADFNGGEFYKDGEGK